MAFDAVVERECGVGVERFGVVEFVAEGGDGLAACGGAGGVEPDVQGAGDDLEVTGVHASRSSARPWSSPWA